ncbi:MAG: bifunctional riboflavin kinase/FAD synthetase [Micrococcales bacterium]
MLRWFSLAEIPADFPETAVTIGKFDGVHLGHQCLLNETVELSEEHGLAAVAVTFDRHPNSVLDPKALRQNLIGVHQKLEQFEFAGIDASLVLHFDENLSNQGPEQFIEATLVNGLNAKVVVVGEDFRFGAGGAGDVETLKQAGAEFGFKVRVAPSIEVDGLKVSSTAIRELLDVGDVKQAAKLLGRRHTTRGMVEHGLKLGRQLGFPTANLSRQSEGYLPLDGVYAGWLYCNDIKYPAALSVGINETLQEVPRLVEAHVLDRDDLDLYDQVVTIEYVDFLRPAAKFSGMDELISAIDADCQAIKGILARS